MKPVAWKERMALRLQRQVRKGIHAMNLKRMSDPSFGQCHAALMRYVSDARKSGEIARAKSLVSFARMAREVHGNR